MQGPSLRMKKNESTPVLSQPLVCVLWAAYNYASTSLAIV